MNIDIESTIDPIEYEKNQQITFFHSKKHLNFLSDLLNSKPFFITARQKNQIVGIIPFFIKSSIHGKVINSLPFFSSHGGVISRDNQVKKLLLERMNIFNKENDVLSSSIVTNPFETDSEIYEKYFKFNSKEDRLTQCTVLQGLSKDILWKNVEKRTRYSIKKGQKDGVEVISVDINEVAERFYHVYEDGMKLKSSNLKPVQFFDFVKKNFEQNKDYEIFVAVKDKEEIAYLLVFYYRKFTEYYMPAFKLNKKHLNGVSQLIWESMKNSIDRGMYYYNFGGTLKNQNSLYLFKRGWFAKDFHYNYYIFGDIQRINNVGINELKKHYPYFYVFSYDRIRV
ncbi:MAG: peptidoglycan bridge formation glycyltransferase FemA/FemB family protein [Nitrosopumilaceae archaeon]